MSIGNCPIWKPNIEGEKCLRMAGEGDNIYDIGVTVAFLTLVRKDASKMPRGNDFSHPCLLFLQTRSLFWSSWLWSFRLSLPRLWICPMVSKPWHFKTTFITLRSSLLLKLNTLLPQDDLPEPVDFAIHTGQPLPKAKIRPFSLKTLLTVFKFDLQDADRS